jgi:16S rRNA (guanine1516-N2)-methyltransferase
VYVDFVHGAAGYRRRQNEGLRQPLAKAIGIKGNDRPSLLDATPGLGRDAFVLACLGCRVTMIERSPIVHALLENGLQRALRNEEVKSIIAQHLHLIAGDACDTLARCKEEERPDVVYLDPMYPHRTKSALVKKEMRMLRGIVGDDEDAPSLLHLALEHAHKRVAVKRPRLAPPLEAEISPSMSIEGKNTRYDVYITSHS